MTQRMKYFLLVLISTFATAACNGPGSSTAASERSPAAILPDSSLEDPKNPPVTVEVPNATPDQRSYTIDALIFNGTGVSVSDWQNTEIIVKSLGMNYHLANSAQLNAMTLDEIASFGLIIVPGGSGGTITGNLTTATRLNVRKAVRDRGVGYVGFCAGAWVAVGPEADTDQTAGYGMAVAKGDVLPYFWPDGNSSLVAAMVPVSFPDGSSRELVWWGGPSTPEWSDGVVARYKNGSPAISQTRSGKGFVVISGPHPEAPEGWRLTAGNDSDGLDYDIAIDMIKAAIHQRPLQAF